MRTLNEYVRTAKYIVALENEGFDSVNLYKNELFDIVSRLLTTPKQ